MFSSVFEARWIPQPDTHVWVREREFGFVDPVVYPRDHWTPVSVRRQMLRQRIEMGRLTDGAPRVLVARAPDPGAPPRHHPSPPTVSPSLFLDSAALDPSDPAALLAFADRYGTLGVGKARWCLRPGPAPIASFTMERLA